MQRTPCRTSRCAASKGELAAFALLHHGHRASRDDAAPPLILLVLAHCCKSPSWTQTPIIPLRDWPCDWPCDWLLTLPPLPALSPRTCHQEPTSKPGPRKGACSPSHVSWRQVPAPPLLLKALGRHGHYLIPHLDVQVPTDWAIQITTYIVVWLVRLHH